MSTDGQPLSSQASSQSLRFIPMHFLFITWPAGGAGAGHGVRDGADQQWWLRGCACHNKRWRKGYLFATL